MATAKQLLALAAKYIGVKEDPPDSNRVKFNTAYYGREVSGAAYPWCCVFIWYLFRETGASALFFGGNKTASCTALYNYHKQRGQAVQASQIKPGDLVFFNFDGNAKVMNHIGICESAGGGYVTTIDGNTGTTSEANGGAVMRRKRALKYVGGVIRPAYAVEVDALTSALNKLVRLGVIRASDYWAASAADLPYLDDLIIKAAAKITRAGNAVPGVSAALTALVAAGVIAAPDYWQKNYGKVPYLDQLICKLAGAV